MISQGQIILTLGAVALFMYTTIQVNRSYLQAVESTVTHQANLDAINFGLSISERLYSTDYDNLTTNWGDFDDVNDPDRRLSHITQAEEDLFATIQFEEKELPYGVDGRFATITVYSYRDAAFHFESQHLAALAPF